MKYFWKMFLIGSLFSLVRCAVVIHAIDSDLVQGPGPHESQRVLSRQVRETGREYCDDPNFGKEKKWKSSSLTTPETWIDKAINSINVERRKHRLSDLRKSPELCQIAQYYADKTVEADQTKNPHPDPNKDCNSKMWSYSFTAKVSDEDLRPGVTWYEVVRFIYDNEMPKPKEENDDDGGGQDHAKGLIALKSNIYPLAHKQIGPKWVCLAMSKSTRNDNKDWVRVVALYWPPETEPTATTVKCLGTTFVSHPGIIMFGFLVLPGLKSLFC